jgi:Ser/Thr protein kinase RdoA (MazF antagonist)
VLHSSAPPGPSPHTDLFLSLTPDRVLAAVEAGGLRCNAVCYPLNSFENRVYEVELEDRSRIVAKFYRPGRWSEAAILEEHGFLAELAEDEIPVCSMRPFPGGGTLRQTDGIYYCLADRMGASTDELTRRPRAGRGCWPGGCMRTRRAEAGTAPAPPGCQTYIREPVDWLERHETIPHSWRARYLGAAREVANLIDARMEGVAVQRVHGDLHLGNLLFRDGLLRVLDFDDMVTGPPVQDLWLALPGRDRTTLDLREAFLEGYEQFRLFDRSTLPLIEPLRTLRIVHYAGWLARRWHDPPSPSPGPTPAPTVLAKKRGRGIWRPSWRSCAGRLRTGRRAKARARPGALRKRRPS